MKGCRLVLLVVLLVGILVSSSCAPQATPTEAVAKLQVALIFHTRITDGQFQQMIYDGAQRALKDFGDKVEIKIIESNGLEEFEENLRAMSKGDYDLVAVSTFTTASILTTVATDFPNQKYLTIDPFVDLPNVRSAQFKEHEGTFQMGVLAGLMTKTGKVGYVGATDSPFGTRWEYGYEQGVHYVDPNIQVFDARVGGHNDPARAKELALAHFAQGCDFIQGSAAASNYGIMEAAREKGFLTTSIDSDECYMDPEHVVGSMIKRSDVPLYDAVKALVEGNFTTGLLKYGAKENAVGLCLLLFPDHPKNAVPQEVLDKIEAARQKIASGEIKVIDYVETGTKE